MFNFQQANKKPEPVKQSSGPQAIDLGNDIEDDNEAQTVDTDHGAATAGGRGRGKRKRGGGKGEIISIRGGFA